MFFSKFSAALALAPLLTMGNPVLEVAQSQDPYSDWTYLYEETFEDSSSQQYSQQLWLNPEYQRSNNILEFTLLVRRSPASRNGTAAALYDYVADCETIRYSWETVTYLDSNNAVIDTQTNRRAMDEAEPESKFYSVLNGLCNGDY